MYPEFEVHRLNEEGMKKAYKIAATFEGTLSELLDIGLTPSRELSIVRTKLEEACFFAKKALANKPENQIQ